MKFRLAPGVAMIFFLASISQANPLTENPIFTELVGTWTGEGTLKGSDGTDLPLTETWTGKMTDEATFEVNGKRTLNGEDQEYTWTYSYNASSEVFDYQYSQTGMDQPLHFEVSVSAPNRTMSLMTPFGNSGSLSIVNTFTKKEGEFDSEVAILDAQGQTQISGTVKNTRQAKP